MKAPGWRWRCGIVAGRAGWPARWRAGRDVWVTEDSVSMIYEALTAGCRVGLLPLPRKSAGRLHRAVDRLIEEGFVCGRNDLDAGMELPAPPRTLDEANRCAGLLLEKGLLAETPRLATCP